MRIHRYGVLMFGKYSGQGLPSPLIPLAYLEWCAENVDFSQSEAKMVQDEIKRRGEAQQSHHAYALPVMPPKNKQGVSTETLLRVISAGRKVLAAKHHPDAGGDAIEMVAVNQAADYLEQIARGISPTG